MGQMAEALGVAGARIWRSDRAALGSDGVGPMSSESAPGLVAVCDGQIDDRTRLGAELGLVPLAARELSEAELILRAYRAWGEQCLEHLIGDLTFVVWDRQRDVLVAAASAPVGRSLYYHFGAEGIAFASRARGLFALGQIPRRLDTERIANFLTRADTGQERSFFEDIHRLLPGELIRCGRDGFRRTHWWRFDFDRRLELAGDDEYVDAFTDLYRQVLDDHLTGESTGLLLSGGLDSGSIAALAAPLLAAQNRRLKTFTEVPDRSFGGVLPEGRYADESSRVKALAALHSNIDLSLVDGRARALLDGAESFFAAAESPFTNAANRGWIEAIYRLAAEAGIEVLLNGDHGNLTVSWPGSGLLPELLKQGRACRAWQEARAGVVESHAVSTMRALIRDGVRPLLPAGVNYALTAARQLETPRHRDPYATYSLISPEFAAEINLAARDVRSRTRMLGIVEGDGRRQRLRQVVNLGSLGSEVRAGYRTMFGVDTRSPLTDRRLVEFCLALPEIQCARNGEQRLLMRRAMVGRLPPSTLTGSQRGLQAPGWFEAMTAERPSLLEAVGRFEQDESIKHVLDLPRLRRLLERWPQQSPTRSPEFELYRGAIGKAMMAGAFIVWAKAELGVS